ncbi:hypothetical protein ABBQ32_005777 [Trebouxia sp. C0010 RCD-2024]
MDTQDVDVCWVCLAPADPTQPLIHACQCPRTVHKECLARWQLQSVGRSEETECRFCHRELPDWRAAYNLPTATPVMTVCHNNVQHLLHVKPGDAGKTAFEDSIRRIFGLGPQDIIQLEFGCKAPGTDQDLTLKGWQSYDAAVHCAAVSAGARQGKCTSQAAKKHHGQPVQTPAQQISGNVATAWSAAAPVQRGHSRGPQFAHVGNTAQPAGITRDSLLLHTSGKHRPAQSLLPAVLNRLHAGVKRSRQLV